MHDVSKRGAIRKDETLANSNEERNVKIKSYNKVDVVRDAGTSETSMARPVDDVCPWDVVPGPSIEHDIDTGAQLRHPISSGVTSSVESQAEEGNNNLISQSHSIEVAARPSRKNSSQFDSCSSSSDVSLAVTEAVSEHLRKSCSLQQSSSTGKFFFVYPLSVE